MKKALRFARGLQLLGALFLVWGIVAVSGREADFAWKFIVGLVLIVGPRVYEWLTKE